jgi:hypothetical protein
MAPYLRRSRITAWKKAKEKTSSLKSWAFEQELYSFYEMSLYVRSKFAFRPFGGSFVIFILACKTGTGKAVLGIDVSQSR